MIPQTARNDTKMSFDIVLYVMSFLISIMIVIQNGIKRLCLFVIGISFIPYDIELINHLNSHRILLLSFFLSIFVRRNEICKIIRFPLLKTFVLVFVSYVMTAVMDSNQHLLPAVFQAHLVYAETFGSIILGYVTLTENKDFIILNRLLRKIIVISSIYSIISLSLGYDIFNSMWEGSDSMKGGDRLRIASFFGNSHFAGFTMSVFVVYAIMIDYMMGKKILFDYIIWLGIIAIVLTGSRSSILCLLFGALYIWIVNAKITNYLVVIPILVLVILLSTNLIQRFINSFMYSDVKMDEGSSIAMRLQQLEYSIIYFKQNPWFGNGFRFFWNNIKATDGYDSSMLLGAESFVFILLIERGIIQIFTIILCFTSLFYFFKKKTTTLNVLGTSLLILFLINSFATGNDEKWIVVFPLIGLCIKNNEIN